MGRTKLVFDAEKIEKSHLESGSCMWLTTTWAHYNLVTGIGKSCIFEANLQATELFFSSLTIKNSLLL